MVAWETMALSSYFLVTSNHKIPAIRSAGFLYLLLAHIGVAVFVAGATLVENYESEKDVWRRAFHRPRASR